MQGSTAGSIPATRKTRGIGTLALTAATATPALRQQAAGSGNTGTITADWSQATATGSLLILAVTANGGSSNTITATGWTLIRRTDNGTNVGVALYYKANAASESGTVSVGATAGLNTLIRIAEYTGLAVTPLDKDAGTTGNSSTPASGTTAATAAANQLWIAALALDFSGTQTAWTNGFATVGETTSNVSMAVSSKNVTATGTADTSSTASTSGQWAGVIATFTALSLSQTGGRHVIAHDDGTNFDIWAIDRDALGSGTWASIDANRAATDRAYPVAFASGLGHILYTHKDFATMRKWDGTTAANVGGTPPEGRALAFYRNRFFCGGTTANPSRLFYSNLGDEDTWTVGSDFIDVNQDDGEPIEDIVGSEDGLVIAKLSSLWFLSGTGPDSFALHHLNPGRGYPGRCLLPTPYGVMAVGKKQVWLWAGGAPRVISDAIEGTYDVGGYYVTTAYADDVAYICDSGTGTIWCYDLRRGVWWTETVKTSVEKPATIFAHGDRLMYGPTAGTVASLLNYRDEPGGARQRDVGQTQDYKVWSREEYGSDWQKITPIRLVLRLRQRNGDASDAGLVVTPYYDGTAETARTVTPQATSGVFFDRVDIGDGFAKDRVSFRFEQALTTADDAILEIEAGWLEVQYEERAFR